MDGREVRRMLEPQIAAVRDADRDRLVRVEIPMPQPPSMAWLAAQDAAVKLFWAGRDGCETAAGLGCAVQWPELNALPSPCAARCYAVLPFDPARGPGAPWQEFPAPWVFVPRFEWRATPEGAALACTFAPDHVQSRADACVDALAMLDAMRFDPPASETPRPRLIATQLHPDRTGWTAKVDAATAAVKTGALDKIVVARRADHRFDAPLDPLAVLQSLASPDEPVYRFCFQPKPGLAFLGATPERLFLRRGRHIASEALAGTRPRGRDAAKDAALGHALLDSDKDRREHAIVAADVHAALTPLCTQLTGPGSPSLARLAHCQHLRTPLEGALRQGVTDAHVLDALHPTPAVAGLPRGAALETIDALESFSRGCYAGPVGWLDGDCAEFAVAIRSGVVAHDTLTAYAGAGIVPGSSVEEEWAESETKMRHFAGLLES